MKYLRIWLAQSLSGTSPPCFLDLCVISYGYSSRISSNMDDISMVFLWYIYDVSLPVPNEMWPWYYRGTLTSRHGGWLRADMTDWFVRCYQKVHLLALLAGLICAAFLWVATAVDQGFFEFFLVMLGLGLIFSRFWFAEPSIVFKMKPLQEPVAAFPFFGSLAFHVPHEWLNVVPYV